MRTTRFVHVRPEGVRARERGWLVMGLLVAGMVVMAGCGNDEEARQELAGVEVEEFRFQELPGGGRVLTGVFHNPTAQPVDNAYIEVALYDANNVRVSTMNIPMQRVPPGERKSFREVVDSDLPIQRASVKRVVIM